MSIRSVAFKPTVLALSLAAAFAVVPALAQSLPSGGTAIHGTVTLDASQANKLLVTTTNGAGTSHSAINWQSFNIGAGNTTQINQPNAASTSINRVVTNTPSALFGNLSSNGRVVLVNQAGITIGAGAYVDTAGFTASVVGMSEANAKAGRLKFDSNVLNGGGDSGAFSTLNVQGNIIARGGDVVLIAPSIELAKTAVVEAQGGSVMLAAGQSVEVTGRGLEGITMQVQAPTDSAINLGTLRGDAVGIFAGTLKHSGLIQANLITGEGGKVLLKAAGDAYLEGNGQILATSPSGKGGRVDVLGSRVAIADQALVDVSGQTGGGTIRVGGDFQGKNPEVPNAQVTYLGPDATLKADALDLGHGGRVIVWADDTTRADGHISVRGGASGGDGGFVETSGKKYLSATRAPDIAAPQGKGGLWLLDPNDINIVHATGATDVSIQTGCSNPVCLSPSQADNSASTLTDFTINAALASGDVWVLTASSNGGTGDINFDPSVGGAVVISNPSSVARGLILTADGVVRFKAGTTTFQSPSSASSLNVQLNGNFGAITDAGAVVTLNGAGSNGLALATLDTTRTWTNNGTLNITGNAQVHLNNASGASTLTNAAGGVVNVAGTTGFAFYSSATDSSVINNQSVINVTQGTAFEATYSQGAGGTLTVKDTYLNLQSVQSISGIVDLMPSGASGPGTLNVNEYHGGAGTFSGTSFPSAGFLNVDGGVGVPVATFSGVSAGQTQLSVGSSQSGRIALGAGNTVFASVSMGGGGLFLSMTNANLGIKSGNFTIPAIGSYVGDNGFYATGNITLSSGAPISSSGVNITLMASWDGVSAMSASAGQAGSAGISLIGNLSIYPGNLTLLAKGNINQTGGFINVGNLTAFTGGNIALGQNNFLSGDLNVVSTGGGNITFVGTASTFNIIDASTTGNINITSSGSLTSDGAISGANISFIAPAGYTSYDQINATGTLTVNTTGANGSISQSGGTITVAGLTSISAGSGTVNLSSSPQNDFSSIAVSGTGSVTIGDVNAVVLANISGSSVHVTANGAITQSAGTSINASSSTSLASGSGAITLNNAGNNFNYLSVTSTGAVSLTNGSGSLDFSTITAGSFTLVSGGDIGTYNNITATTGGIDIRTTGGTINLDTDGAAVVTSAAGVLLKATGGLDVGGVDFHVNAGHTIVLGSDAGTLYASGATIIGGANWLTYLSNPALSHVYGPFDPALADFRQVNAVFGTNPLGTGNGSLWSVNPSPLSGSLTGFVTKVFDGVGNIDLAGAQAVGLSGGLFGEISGSLSGFGGLSNVNVGTNRLVTSSTGNLMAVDGSGKPTYGYAFTGSGNIGTVTPAPLATWIASGSGLWSDPYNWSLSPLYGNVLAVAIPAGASVIYDASAGSTSLQSITSLGSFSLTGGNLTISSSLSTAQYSQSGGALSGAGALTVNGSFAQTGGTIDIGSVNITQTTGNLTVGPVRTASISLTALNGNIDLNSVSAIDVKGILAANGNIVLNNTGGISTSGAVLAPKGSVRMTANSPLTIGADGISASGDISLIATNLTSPGNVTLNGNLTSSAGAIALDAAGNLTQNSVVNGALGVSAKAGGSMLFGPLASTTGNPISYLANGASVTPPGAGGNSGLNFLDVFLDKFEDALAAQNTDSSDPLNKKNKTKDKDTLVVEGETCKP